METVIEAILNVAFAISVIGIMSILGFAIWGMSLIAWWLPLALFGAMIMSSWVFYQIDGE